MNRLETFLEQLRGQGISATCNWQVKRGKGFIEHYTMRDGARFCMVIFNTYGKEAGFHTYVESGNQQFAQDIESIKNQLNADI